MDNATVQGFRLSPQQRRLWRLGGDGAAFRGTAVIELEGPLDRRRLRRAVEDVVARHEILRTAFHRQPGMAVPIQVVAERASAAWREEDLEVGAELPSSDLILDARRRAPLVLDGHTPLYAAVLSSGSRRHALALDLPALCADWRSLVNLFDEIAKAYDGGAADDRDPEPVQYVQFAAWQHELLEDREEAAAGRAFWQRQAYDAIAPLALPFAYPPRGDQQAPRWVETGLDGELLSRVAAAAAALDCGLDVFWLACWQALLWRLNDRRPVAIDTETDGRGFDELETAVGPLAGPLPLAPALDAAMPFRALVKSLQTAVGEAAPWQPHLPESIAPALARYAFEELPPARQAGGLRWRLRPPRCVADGSSLELRVVAGDQARLELRYDPSRFDAVDLRQLGASLCGLAASAAASPATAVATLEAIDPATRERLVTAFNDTDSAASPLPVHRRFAAASAAAPERPALVFEEERWCFAELDRASNRLANHLRSLGAGPERRVAVVLERSAAMIVATLGVLKAGAALVPIDAGQPPARLAAIVEDSGAALAVSSGSGRRALAATGVRVVCLERDQALLRAAGEEDPAVPVAGANLAYVIFTSGSSGRPKGVAVEHRQLSHYLDAVVERLQLPAGARYAMASTFGADLGHTSVFPALCSGGCLHVISEQRALDAEALAAYFEQHRIDCLKIVPSHFQALERLLEEGVLMPRQRLVLGGEACRREWASAWLAKAGRCRVFNHYGPSETTVGVMAHEVTAAGDDPRTTSVPLGRPLPRCRVYVLDPEGRPQPPWLPGELVLAGPGLARGYLDRPAATAERFVPDPFAAEPGGRGYRSGDRGRHLSGPAIEFLGRLDHQVKVRGFRVELGEVERCLSDHHGVDQAVAVIREDRGGDPRLTAYVVPARRHAARIDGRQRFALPNGMAIAHQNRNETEYLFHEIFTRRTYARHGIRLGAAPVVIDIGANIGLFTLFVARHRPQARIVSFEPIPPLFETLRLNAELYAPRAEVYQAGISDRERVEPFTFYPQYTMMSGQRSYADPALETEVVRRALVNAEREGSEQAATLLDNADELLAGRFEGRTFDCRLRRLSEVLRALDLPRVDLLKIDAQRAELDVLHGLEEDDWPGIDQLVMEVHDQQGGATAGRTGAIASSLERRGFTVVVEQDELLVGTDRWALFAHRGEPLGEPLSEPLGEPPPAVEEPVVLEHDPEVLRRWVRSRLPEPMQPAALVVLDELPLTRNGKVDRDALPAPEAATAPAAYLAPRDATETQVAAVWAEVLGHERVSVDRDFFALGGHSLLAIRIMSRLRRLCAVELPVRTIFEAPTVAGLARRVSAAAAGAGEAPAPAAPVAAAGTLEDELAALERLAEDDAAAMVEGEG